MVCQWMNLSPNENVKYNSYCSELLILMFDVTGVDT